MEIIRKLEGNCKRNDTRQSRNSDNERRGENRERETRVTYRAPGKECKQSGPCSLTVMKTRMGDKEQATMSRRKHERKCGERNVAGGKIEEKNDAIQIH